MGYPDLRILVIQHPLGGIPPEEVMQKVPGAVAIVSQIAGVNS